MGLQGSREQSVRVNITPHMIRTQPQLTFSYHQFLIEFFLGAKAISWEMIRAVHHKL